MKYSRCIGLILCLYVSLYWIEVKERVNTSIITRSLEVDGFCCMFNPEYIKTQKYSLCKFTKRYFTETTRWICVYRLYI